MLKCCADAIAFCCGFVAKSFEERIEDLEDEAEGLKFDLKDAKGLIYDLEVKSGQPKAKKTPGGWTSAYAWDKYVQPKVVNYAPVDAEEDYTAVDMKGFAKKKASAYKFLGR